MSRAYYNFLLAFYREKERRKLQRRHIRDICNPFELPEAEFYHIYRINKPMALYICEELGEDLAPLTREGLPTYIKVLTAIKFLADGGYQRGTGQDHNLGLGQTTVSKYLSQFISAVNRRLMRAWIQFPGTEEARRHISNGFSTKFGLPNILGAIDCTHVSIFPPPRPQGAQYINRKGRHTLNVQLIADADCKIIHVNARFPGRVHDQFIFNSSVVKTELKRLYENRIGDYHLLGDSGYALEPWMMTPILDAERDSPGDKYTQWHIRTRNVIERTNGYLKGSLRCLGIDRTLHYDPEKASQIIYACCTLYNIMKHYRVPMQEDDASDIIENVNQNLPAHQPAQLLNIALAKRNNLVQLYFS